MNSSALPRRPARGEAANCGARTRRSRPSGRSSRPAGSHVDAARHDGSRRLDARTEQLRRLEHPLCRSLTRGRQALRRFKRLPSVAGVQGLAQCSGSELLADLEAAAPRTLPAHGATASGAPAPTWLLVRRHYREQLKAETKKPRRKCQGTTCELSDFVFNVELVTAGRRRIVDSWTGTLDSLAFEHDHFVCPIDAGPWYNSWGMPRGGGPGPMRLEVFVSRALHGQIKTRKLYVSCNEPNEPIGDGIDAFESVSLPMTRPRAVRDDRGSHFQDDHEVETHLRLVLDRTRSPYSAIDLEFLLYCPASGEDEYMSKEQVLSYLEHDISWYSRKEEKRLHWK